MKPINQTELKQVQLDILNDIHVFCSENGIRYYLFVGTLLGAIRHQGYIPWDDDIDICMRREDYSKFFETYNRHPDKTYYAINADIDKMEFLKFIVSLFIFRAIHYRQLILLSKEQEKQKR